eukprot:317948-Prymnesium_polylepis.2
MVSRRMFRSGAHTRQATSHAASGAHAKGDGHSNSAALLTACAHPAEQLRLVGTKIVDLELEDEAPGEAEDERAVAVDQVLRADVDELPSRGERA